MLMDVSRAFFYAPAQRDLWVELPEEDKDVKADEVGKLKRAMYGTRDAPLAWSLEVEDSQNHRFREGDIRTMLLLP